MFDENIKKLDVESSHSRCNNINLNKDLLYSRKIIKDGELQKKFVKYRDLIITAAPYMEQLCTFVKNSNFFALLTDEEGCILNAIGDEGILSEAFDMRMIPGAYMNEENIGTNAMSVVLDTGKSVQISGKEHYINAYHKWTCSAAPIKDTYGEIIGVLNLTGYSDCVHLHTLGMVMVAANAIEQMLKIKQYNKNSRYSSEKLKSIFDCIPTGIITSDAKGKITAYNNKILGMFGFSEEKMAHVWIEDLVEDWKYIERMMYKGSSVENEEISVISQNNKVRFNLSVYPIYNSDENVDEIVYIFEDIKRERNLAAKVTSSRAIYTFDKIIGENENFVKIVEYAKKIADSKSTILITGESGTGKEIFAQSIHNYSSRSSSPFIAVNCSAIPRELIESELFGYVEGSFTGAKKGGNPGKFEIANMGTIFLDEIGEMPVDMQTKLLRVIQEGVIYPIGSSKPLIVNVRIIAATNKDLKKEVAKGTFRKDLFYRLNVLPLYLPPLRDRKDDIILLINYFMKTLSKRLNKKEVEIPDIYLQALQKYSWTGNIRELENVVELIINTESIPATIAGMAEDNEDNEENEEELIFINEEHFKLEYMEKQHIENILNKFKGNITAAAAALGIGRNTLYSKLSKYNISLHRQE